MCVIPINWAGRGATPTSELSELGARRRPALTSGTLDWAGTGARPYIKFYGSDLPCSNAPIRTQTCRDRFSDFTQKFRACAGWARVFS